MNQQMDNMENITINSNDGQIVHSKPTITIHTELEIAGQGGLPIIITADFTNIPNHKHDMFLQALKMMYKL